MEGKNVPQWLPRPVMALIATGAAVVVCGLSTVPASADSVRNNEWWLSELHVTTAWMATQGAGVTVAVLSDGVDASQPDLTGVVTAAPAPSGAPTATAPYLGQDGTGIASLIAGHGHGLGDGAGIVGVAPDARILSVPVTLPPDDPMLTDPTVGATIPDAIAAGIMYAVRNHASVIDLPIDPGQPNANGIGGDSAAAGGSPAELKAVDYALSHDVVLVAPAGDDQTTTGAANYPAAYPGVIAVGAFNRLFVKAPYSSHDSYVTVTAAGAGVTAAANTGGYQTMNSTSAASAIVSGIVALIRSRYPALSVTEVRKALITSTVYRPPGGLLDGSGYGTVDAGRALAAAAQLATSPAQRADANAQQAVAPGAITASTPTSSLTPRIIRSAEISVALLVVLLLLVGLYAMSGRRKARRKAAATAEWAHHATQSRYPQASPGTDPILEYFAAPLDSTARFAGGSPADLMLAAEADGRAGQPWGLDRDPAEAGATPALRPASRAVSRRPSVAGTPPWEPAPPPAGDLPWTASSTAGPPTLAALPPGDSVPTAGGSRGARASSPEADAVEEPLSGWVLPSDKRERQAGGQAAAGADLSGTNLPKRATRPSTLAPWGSTGAVVGPSSGGFSRPAAEVAGGSRGDGAAENARHAADRRRLIGRGPAADPMRLADRASAIDKPRLASQSGQAETGDSGAWSTHAAEPAGNPSPAGWNPPALPDTGGWNPPASADGPVRVTAAGLPVRQPRSTPAAGPSPSGSLWEPAASRRDVSGRHDRRSQPRDGFDVQVGDDATGQETGDRPIFVWRPAPSADRYDGPPAD